MVDFHRENHEDQQFDVTFIERPDGWRCTVRRGSNVALSEGGFKTEAAASLWALKAVTAILKLSIDRVFPGAPDVATRPALHAVIASLNAANAPQDVACKHCGHGADEHHPEGGCTGGPGAASDCPCTLFAAVIP